MFLNLGISKDVLLSKDDLGEDESLWPLVGAKLFVELRVKTKITARLIPYHELRVIVGNLNIGDEVEGFIQEIGKIGYFVMRGNTIWIKTQINYVITTNVYIL